VPFLLKEGFVGIHEGGTCLTGLGRGNMSGSAAGFASVLANMAKKRFEKIAV